ncbi:MAG: sensor histidine kinase, partial [Micromonosporaceae bacterium]
VNNFASNAIRYTPPGGKVEIRARRRRSAVIISVRDTGIGIAADHLERIFDRLYRVDEARDRATGGSGLGLSIARRAAQAIGGRIEVDSKTGAGSEFRLIVPVSHSGNSTARMRANQEGTARPGPAQPSGSTTSSNADEPGRTAGAQHQAGKPAPTE